MRLLATAFSISAVVLATGCSSPGSGGVPFVDAGSGASGGFGASGGSAPGGGGAGGTSQSGGAAGSSGAAGAGGTPVPCANGQSRCGADCFDLTQDPLHCGGCDTQCATGEVCQNGICASAPDCHTTPCTGLTYCDLATGLCKPGCVSDTQCGTNESCDLQSHSCGCSAGYSKYPSGVCGNGCEIGGVEYAAGASNGSNSCQTCVPAESNSAWTNVADSTACGSNKYCYGGQCVACLQGSACTPTNACHDGVQQCSSSSASCSDTGSSKANGTSCGSGKVCNNGSCQSGCWVGGSYYASGATSPTNSCQSCQPASSTTSLSPVSNGTSCGSGKVCNGGSCSSGCYIGGSYYANGTASPSDPCKACVASTSTTSWTPVTKGTSCGGGKICDATGACVRGCWISSTFYAENAVDPNNGCRACLPDTSTSAFSNDDGVQCASDSVCFQGSCQKGCYCPTQFTTPAVIAPGTTGNYGCSICDPTKSVQCWSPNPNGGWCYYPSGCCGYCGGTTCNFVGCGTYCP
jgi:hypothetical protein